VMAAVFRKCRRDVPFIATPPIQVWKSVECAPVRDDQVLAETPPCKRLADLASICSGSGKE